jgi:excisionase family DNA binding protein
MTDIKVYTLDEVAGIIKVTRRTLYTYLKEGKLKAVKIGKYWRVSEEALKVFISTGTTVADANRRKENQQG